MKIRLLFLLFFTISFSLYTQENNQGIFTILGNSTKHFYVKNGNTVYKKNYKDYCIDTLFFNNTTYSNIKIYIIILKDIDNRIYNIFYYL